VKNSLNVFFDDMDKITKEFGIANYEHSVVIRVRTIVCDLNDCISKNSIFSPEQLSSIKRSANKAFLYFEKEIRDHFKEFTDFDNFKKIYPDLLDELYEVYDKYELNNDCGINRSNYIKKHVELSFDEFKTIILRRPQLLMVEAFDQIYEGVDEEIQRKLVERLTSLGIIVGNSSSLHIGLALLSYTLIGLSYTLLVDLVALRAAGFLLGKPLGY